MSKIISFQKTVADSILTAALSVYPRETILMLQGKKVGDEITLSNVLIPPLATYGHGFSALFGSMLPWDLTIMGIAHSHPSGALKPSTHDLNHFYGHVLVIAAHPFLSYDDLGAFDPAGQKIPHTIVPDN